MSGICHSRRLSRAGGHLEQQMNLPKMKRQPRSTVPVKRTSLCSSAPAPFPSPWQGVREKATAGDAAQENGAGLLQHQAGVSREMSAVSLRRVRVSITRGISDKEHSERVCWGGEKRNPSHTCVKLHCSFLLSVCPTTQIALFLISFLPTEPQNHRMFGVGRDLCGSCSPTPLPKQAYL